MQGIIRINLVTDDPVLAKRLSTYCAREKDLQATVTRDPLPEGETDLYLLPVARALSCAEEPLPGPSTVPTIAYGAPEGLRAAFLSGCVDFLREPWALEELSLRVRRAVPSPRFALAGVELILRGMNMASRFGSIALSLPEERILRALLLRKGSVVPRATLFGALWGGPPARRSRAVDAHVSSLRRKLRRLLPGCSGLSLIRSVRRVGYLLADPPEV